MQSMKVLLTAAVLAGSATASADAQPARPFRDSWFWGVRAGAVSYAAGDPLNPTAPGISSMAPLVGGDWLITRQKGGLYLGYSQAFVTTQGLVVNGPTSADSGFRTVDVSGLRKFDLAVMAFPGDFLRWHPYVGGGFAFRYLGAAEPQGPMTEKQADFALSAVNEVKAAIGPLFIIGGQYRLKFISAFGQLTASTTAADFLLANGKSMSLSTEFGFRYNLGSSIDRN